MSEPETVTARLTLALHGGKIDAEVAVPAGLTSADRLLPLARGLAEQVIGLAVLNIEEEGKSVSCRAGCGACCRQLVPISEPEARRLREVVEALPEPRRSTILARFAEAFSKLDAAGVLASLRDRGRWHAGSSREVGLEYFRQRVACPFLEDESCSIYEERPIACREYLVTSPAENCTDPGPDKIAMVPIAGSVWNAFARLDAPEVGSNAIRWLPLILALEWAEAHPEPSAPRPGPELLRDLIGNLSRGKSSEPESLLE